MNSVYNKLVIKNVKQLPEAEKLVQQKNLTREDLQLILSTFKLRDEKAPQAMAVASEEKKQIRGITVQISNSMIAPLYESIGIAEQILKFSKDKGWSEEQLLSATNIIQSLEHFS